MGVKEKRKKPWIDVKALRASRGWAQWKAAEHLKISRTYLSYLENGKCGFSVKVVEAIINVFDVTYEDFFQDPV